MLEITHSASRRTVEQSVRRMCSSLLTSEGHVKKSLGLNDADAQETAARWAVLAVFAAVGPA